MSKNCCDRFTNDVKGVEKKKRGTATTATTITTPAGAQWQQQFRSFYFDTNPRLGILNYVSHISYIGYV